MAGFVNAPYATFDESLGIKGVHERVYKGYCRNEGITEFVRQEFIQRGGGNYRCDGPEQELF